MRLDEYLLCYPLNHEENVSGVLHHISTRLHGDMENAGQPAGSEPGAVNWRGCESMELQSDGRKYNWVFKGTETSVADFFKHLAGQGCPIGYSLSRPKVRRADTAGVLSFLAACLD